MMLFNFCGALAVILTVSVPVRAIDEYTRENDEELFNEFHNSKCDKKGLNDNSYQYVLTSNNVMGDLGYVYAYPKQYCPPGSLFIQEQCNCIYSNLELGRQLGSGNQSPFQAQCSILADISYSQVLGAYNSTTYIRRGEEQAKAKLELLTEGGVSGSSSGYALRMPGEPFVLPAFDSNDLVGPWESEVRVKPSGNSRMVLLSDDCDKSDQQKSFELVVQGSQLSFSFRFTNDSVNSNCLVQPDNNGWYDIKLTSSKTDIVITVNGNPCFSVDPKAPLARTECSHFLGAHPKGYTDAFAGYLDFFKFCKNCQYCQ